MQKLDQKIIRHSQQAQLEKWRQDQFSTTEVGKNTDDKREHDTQITTVTLGKKIATEKVLPKDDRKWIPSLTAQSCL